MKMQEPGCFTRFSWSKNPLLGVGRDGHPPIVDNLRDSFCVSHDRPHKGVGAEPYFLDGKSKRERERERENTGISFGRTREREGMEGADVFRKIVTTVFE